MVCDAGGSTVDITTFEVKRTDKKRMRLNEVAASCEYIESTDRASALTNEYWPKAPAQEESMLISHSEYIWLKS